MYKCVPETLVSPHYDGSRLLLDSIFVMIDPLSGRNSGVECLLPKQDVVGSNPIARSKLFFGSEFTRVVDSVVDLRF